MERIGSYDAKTHLPRLLDMVAKGKQFTITKHGVPVAKLVPVEPGGEHDIKAAIDGMKTFRKGRRLQGTSIRQMIEEGRRY